MIAKDLTGKFVVVKTENGGTFAGHFLERHGTEVSLKTAFRILYWKGTFHHSELAVEGVQDPYDCVFGLRCRRLVITNAVEIWECDPRVEETMSATWGDRGYPPIFESS